MRQTKGGDVFYWYGFLFGNQYMQTSCYWGFVAKGGRAIIGVDLDDDAWGLVIWRWYAGYKFKEG